MTRCWHPTYLSRLLCPTSLCGLLYLGPVLVMSGLPLWAACLLFTRRLLWLLLQAAPAQPVALDPVLRTYIAPGPTEPLPSDQQTPPMNSFMAEDFESLLLNSEPSALPPEVPEETEAVPTPQESPAHPPEDPEAGGHSSTQEDTSAQSAVSHELDQSVQVSDGLFNQHQISSENVDISGEKNSALPQLPIAGVEPPSVQPKSPAVLPKSSINREETVSPLDSSETQRPVLPYLNITNVDVGDLIAPKHPTKSKPPETEKEASAEKSTKMFKLPIQLGVPPKAPETTELSLFQQKTLDQPASKGSAILLQQTTAPPQHPEGNYLNSVPIHGEQPTYTDVTVPPFNLELTITPETTMEAKNSIALTSIAAPSMHPQVTFPHPEAVQAQQPSLTDVTVRPLDLELTITQENTVEAEHHTTLRKTTFPPKQPEVTFPHPEPVQAQQPTFSITVAPLDLELTVTPEPTVEAQHPTPLQQTAAAPRHLQVTFPQPQPVQAQPHIFSDVRLPPVVLQLTIRREAAEEAEHHTTLRRTTAPPKQAKVTFPHPEPSHAQQTTFSEVRVAPWNPQLIVTPEPPEEAEHARALQQTAAPPKHPLVMFPVQDQLPTLTEVTGHPAQLEFIRTQQPETSESGAPVSEQNAVMNVCELCTCRNETLSCTGLSPKHRLHRVPVLYPQIHNGSFTLLNFKGNSISYIDRDSWESYRWVEKLILSENYLTELHKDSFEGLLSLQYLDLSSNKIQLIERNTFESMPFLQQINLHNNLIANVRFGTFQAWHGMQFLHRLILSHNPLTTVEDSYLFKLPALRYLDMGATQVSLITVESILLMALKLRKLILPSHLACCLCQFKSSIEGVSKTVKLHCDSDCLTHAQCDEELYLGKAEGSLMKVLQGREKRNSPELTIEPERASPGEEKGGGLSAFMNLLMKLLTAQEEVKVSKADWDMDHWGDERTEAQGEEEEQESREFGAQVPGYGYKKKLVLAAPVIAVASIFLVIFCLMAICQRRTAEEGKEGRGFFSIFGHKSRSAEHEMEEGGFQRRWPLWLWDMYWPLNATHKGNVGQSVHHSTSDEGDMEKGEASTTTAKAATSESAAEETAEESDA
ncbi:leucine-rich repeat-containing protein 37A2-like isoform X1 [Phyllostomus discolor]|uniref:Leucine-rich repeat-containing protein 37A2-like isoform X1 n=1 Tax=Phyllostomus discolor TaxID=89673 RepID=A0A6J2L507_9CHIR|nr:leucine-rich repeat-containing protein 37A2-like isoform X1 [Phyllostomus discolor]